MSNPSFLQLYVRKSLEIVEKGELLPVSPITCESI